MKGVVKALIALIIIVGGAGIGYLLANSTDIGKTATATPTVAVAAASVATVTPIPTFTAAAGAAAPISNTLATRPAGQGQSRGSVSPGANPATTPGANPAAGVTTTPGAGAPGQGQGGQGRGNQVAGTISKYDAAAKMLVVTTQDGAKRNVSVANARLSKSDKITLDDLAKATGAIMLVQGERGSDGIYSARTVTMIDPAAGGGFLGGSGAPGGGAGGFPGGGGVPGGGAPGGGAGGAGGQVILNGATVSGNTITGKSFQGEDIKVNVSDTTTLQKQLAATAEDLVEGKRVTVTGQAGTTGDIEAILVTLVG